MELPIHRFQAIKTGIHIFQAFLIFVAWAMTIAVMRGGNVDGRIGWEFGLCFLSVPGIIFLTMTQRFPRSQRLANPYALLAVDFIFTILWISGFASVASWNSAGKCKYCKISKAVVGLGVFIFLFFALTTAMSAYGAKYYRTNGVLPGASRAQNGSSMVDPDKEHFSTAPHDDEYAPVSGHEHESDIHTSMGDRFDTSHKFDTSTSYSGAYGGESSHVGGYGSPHEHEDEHESEPSHEQYGGGSNYGSSSDRVHFPPANYHEGRTPLQI